MDLFNEISWSQFQLLEHIKRLPLNEQAAQYNSYLAELSRQRYLYSQWLANQNKGPKQLTLQNIGVLLQEDLFDLEQEDGSKILITGYA